ncbi:MAG TPA: hypothetical protein VGK17_05120 [Propionicimonas sp.]
MKLDRFRAPALAATAVLLISGVASAFAASPAPAAPVTAAPITQPVAAEPVAAEPVEATDTDTLQEGDQTTPDVAEAPEAAGNEAAEPAEAAEAPEAAGAEKDGPGGHADADGANVDHQFEGEE